MEPLVVAAESGWISEHGATASELLAAACGAGAGGVGGMDIVAGDTKAAGIGATPAGA